MKADGTLHYRRLLTREFLVSRMAAGRKGPDIAVEVGSTITAVYDALRRHGLQGWGQATGPRPNWVDVLTPELLNDRYHAEGKTMIEIAAEIGCSASTVMRALERHGIETRERPPGGSIIYDVPLTDRRDRDVAAEVGAAKSTVTRARLRAGEKRPFVCTNKCTRSRVGGAPTCPSSQLRRVPLTIPRYCD